MTREDYLLWENYMQSCIEDGAHDREHIYRVLYTALDIARTEQNVDYDVLVCACLLHDIGRKEQYENPAVCHAEAGADKAYTFLVENHFAEAFAERVRGCIRAHSFRRDCRSQSLEGKRACKSQTGIGSSFLSKHFAGSPRRIWRRQRVPS